MDSITNIVIKHTCHCNGRSVLFSYFEDYRVIYFRCKYAFNILYALCRVYGECSVDFGDQLYTYISVSWCFIQILLYILT